MRKTKYIAMIVEIQLLHNDTPLAKNAIHKASELKSLSPVPFLSPEIHRYGIATKYFRNAIKPVAISRAL